MAETFEQYRKRVLGYLGTRDPIRVLRRTPGQLERLLTGVSRTVLTARPRSKKWSATEIVAHLADAELAMAWRVRNMIAAPGVPLSWWDEAVWAERLGYRLTPWREAFARFKELRLANLALLRGIPASYWDQCYGNHEKRGRQTIRDFVKLETAHDLNHLRQIESLVQSRML